MADPTSQTKELLTLEVGVDAKKGLLEATRFQRHLSGKMKKIQESTQKMDKGFGRFMKQIQGAKARAKGIKEITDQFKALDKVVRDRKDLVADALGQAKKAKRGSQERKDLMARVAEIKKTSGYDQAYRARQGARTGAKELKETQGFDWKALSEGAEEAGEDLAEPLRDLLSKDAPTLMRRMNKILLGSHKKATALGEFGSGLSKRGADMWKGGGVKGKIAGGAAAVGGGLTQAFAGLAKVITSIGPILSVASSFMMSFVKILLDAEAGVKDFNKQILATTGTSSYLHRNLGDVGAAAEALDTSLRAARDGAINMDNVMMGISKETALSFQSAITAEGVALDRLGNATAGATKNAEAHAKSIQMGVAYSRAFGVSLSEVAQLQGQLMADLGMGAKTVKTSFQTIVDGAHEAGMETNKFFGIIRSFSSDLSLFTLRLAEVSKIMGVLGKTMDPRKMGQFLQTLNQKFSGGLMDNLKFEMLAGPKSTQIAKEDAADKLSNLAKDLKGANIGGGEIDKLIKLLKNPNRDPREIAKWQADNQAKLNGTLNESIQENANVQTKLASGDKIDQASIMESLSPLAKMETLEAAAQKLTGKSFDKLSGLSLAAVEATGIASAKEIQMFMKLKQGIMQGQEELIARVGKGQMKPGDLAQMTRLGIKDAGKKTNEDLVKELRAKFGEKGGDKAFMNSLDKSQQELLMEATKEIDYQKKIADTQSSILDKVAMMSDVILNRIYDMMVDIWKIITDLYFSLPWISADKKDVAQAKKFADENKLPPALMKALAKAGTVDEAGEAVMANFGRDITAKVGEVVKEYSEIKAKLATEKDPAKKKELMDRYKAIYPILKHASKDEKYLKNVNRTLGPKVMLERLVEMQKSLEKAPGISGKAPPGTPAAAAAATPAAAANVAAHGPAAQPAKRAAEKAAKPQEETAEGVKDLHRAVASEGVKLNPASVAGPLTDAMSKSVYEGTAKALFEYYMYSGLNRGDVATAMKGGVTPGAIASSMTTNSGLTPEATLAALQTQAAQGNAMGGTVTGIMNGMARVTRPAPGEGLASVGRGERIVPAGGGGGAVKVQLELKGDFKRYVHARVVEGAANHDRNKRLR